MARNTSASVNWVVDVFFEDTREWILGSADTIRKEGGGHIANVTVQSDSRQFCGEVALDVHRLKLVECHDKDPTMRSVFQSLQAHAKQLEANWQWEQKQRDRTVEHAQPKRRRVG